VEKNPIFLGTADECLLQGTCITTSSIQYVHLPVLLDDFELLKKFVTESVVQIFVLGHISM
jgi:hypothetical protein